MVIWDQICGAVFMGFRGMLIWELLLCSSFEINVCKTLYQDTIVFIRIIRSKPIVQCHPFPNDTVATIQEFI
jgi:hypothetical protein